MGDLSKNKYHAFLFFGILILNTPLFFDIYRSTAFNIVPHDNYVPYLLYLLGEGGSVPQSPTGYRLFSVLIAVPFYYLLPLFKFSYLESNNDIYLKALEALSFVTYLAASCTSFVMYKITKDRFQGSESLAILSALAALLLFRFTAIYSIDPTAILLITLLIFHIQKKWLFATLLLLSVGFNEKIAFFFLMLFAARMVFRKRETYFYFGASVLSFLAYFIIRIIIDLPGHEYMLQPNMFWEKSKHTLSLLFSAKGFYLNILPGIIVFVLYFLALNESRYRKMKNHILFYKTDFIPILGFFVIAVITDMQYTIGRILLFCFPSFLPLAILYLQRIFDRKAGARHL